MKSPWKFLVGLARRHDKQDTPGAIADSSDTASSDSDLSVTPPIELEAAPASSNLDLSTSNSVEDVPEHVDDLATLVAIAAAAAEGKGEKAVVPSDEKPVEKPRRRASGNKRTGVKSTPAQVVTPGDRVQELDDEIHQLRAQLAQKLELQNAQLRKMLARFGN